MSLREVNNISKAYGSSETAVMIAHNRSISPSAGRILQVSNAVLIDLGRCRE